MLAGQLKLVFWFLSLSLQLSAILSRRENDKNNGIVMTLHHMRSEEGFVRRDDDRAYERLAKMVQASKERASALKRGMPISRAGSLYAHSETIEYYIKLSVGTPPQDLLIIMDTGSDVVWLPCTRNYTCNKCPQYSRVFLPRKSSSAVPVKCADPKCKDLCQNQSCVGSLQNCPEYELQYGTGTARGRLLSETLTLPLEDGGKQEIKHFGVGCSVVSSIISGIAGFGKGGLSMPSQLSPLIGDRFAYCLQSHRLFDDKNKSSRMMMGNKAVPKDISLHYTPFLNNSRAPSFPYSIYYYIGLTGISIGGKRLKLPSNLLRFDAQGNGGTIIDSGASVSLFPNSIYYQIVDEFASQIRYRRTREIEAVTCFGLCYNVSGVENIQFPEFVFHFKGGSDMVMPSENTFIACDSHTYCLAMINSGVLEVDIGPSVLLGNYQQQNFYILYDREKNRLGFTPQTCKAFG